MPGVSQESRVKYFVREKLVKTQKYYLNFSDRRARKLFNLPNTLCATAWHSGTGGEIQIGVLDTYCTYKFVVVDWQAEPLYALLCNLAIRLNYRHCSKTKFYQINSQYFEFLKSELICIFISSSHCFKIFFNNPLNTRPFGSLHRDMGPTCLLRI